MQPGWGIEEKASGAGKRKEGSGHVGLVAWGE